MFIYRQDNVVTTAEEERCFIADYQSPDHCLNALDNCPFDVLNFGQRIRRSLDMTVEFDGWFDPQPESDVADESG